MAEVEAEKKPKRRRRWGWFALIGVIALLILGHAFWGWYQNGRLTKEVEALRRKGEPMALGDFKVAAIADEENAAVLLLRAAKLIDMRSPAWQDFNQALLEELPPPAEEMEALKAVVNANTIPLEHLRKARGKRAVWPLDEKQLVLFASRSEFTQLKPLSDVAAGAMLLEHLNGNDAAMLELALDLLAMGDVLQQMPAGVIAHLVANGAAGKATYRLEQIAFELRVGEKAGEARPQDVKRVIERLLAESEVQEGLRRALRVERVGRCRQRGG